MANEPGDQEGGGGFFYRLLHPQFDVSKYTPEQIKDAADGVSDRMGSETHLKSSGDKTKLEVEIPFVKTKKS